MRKIPKLNYPSYKTKEYTLKGLGDFVVSPESVFEGDTVVNGEELKVNATTTSVLNYALDEIKRYYYVRGEHYVYFANNVLKKYFNENWVTICTTETEPCIIPFKDEGQECTLIIGDSAIVICDDGETFTASLPYGNVATLYKEMLFVANGNTLYFSKLHDYKDFTSGLYNSGYITVNADYGEIIALAPTKNALLVVCERAIYNFYAVGDREDYSLVKQDVSIKAKRKSVQRFGDSLYLFSENTLCKYQNGKLTKIKCGLDYGNYLFNAQSGIDGNAYYVALSDSSLNNYLYSYNYITGVELLANVSDIYLSDGGYFAEEYSVKKLSPNGAISLSVDGSNSYNLRSIVEWQSVDLDFGSPLVKSLLGVAVKSKKGLSLKLEYSYGSQTLNFEKGSNLIKMHIIDKSFNVQLINPSLDAGVERIKFIYRLQEE